jgi:hypothetical protein
MRTLPLSSPWSVTCLALCLPGLLAPLAAGEVGFLEDFALARDREEALKQLIPGTEDDFFFRALHFQNTGRLEEAAKLLPPWIERHGRTARVIEMENRQALLGYTKEPRAALDFLRERLGLRFDHERQVPGADLKLPTSLDPALVSREAFARRALERHPGSTDGFEDAALEWALELKLDPDRRRHLLGRLMLPGIPGLARAVMDDLNHKGSGGFGSLGIHRQLLLDELEECLRLKPALLAEAAFVNTYLSKLAPRAGEEWRIDPLPREAYLERLEGFVSRLGAAFNSLKAHVLYHRLVHDRALGRHDRARFLAYLKLPRSAPYVRPGYLERGEHRGHAANLGAEFKGATLLPPIGNDEPVVRSYLGHFFLTEDGYAPFSEYLENGYLKRIFAETKILAGLGDMEKWYAMLSPAVLQELKERVDIDFAFTQKTAFRADEPVGIDVHLKNVKTLIVKVFELNPLNLYRERLREIDAAIDLDGLVASEETTYEITEPALRRISRHFDFPLLSRRGVYVVELIGNGRSSRALIRKGRLKFLERTSVAGHLFTVLDETNRKLEDASLWLGGVEYRADKEGLIAVPYSSSPGRQPIVLIHGGFASLDHFAHQAESYALAAGIHVEREALLARQRAAVIIRPSLTLNGEPVTLSVLEDPTLLITSTDREGVRTTQEVKSFQLFEDREAVHELQVPASLAEIRFTLRAGVQSLSQGKRVELEDERVYSLNGIDATESIEDVHFSRSQAGHALDLLGKSGEPKPGRAVRVAIRHRDFREDFEAQLQTDERGRIALGALDGIAFVVASVPDGEAHSWTLPRDRQARSGSLHARAGAAIRVPYPGATGGAGAPSRLEVSLLETRGGTFVRDWFQAVASRDGLLELRDLPAGDYDLVLKKEPARLRLRVEDGPEGEGHVLAGYRQLELRRSPPLAIAQIEASADSLLVKLHGATRMTRVHVLATRYLPEHPAFDDLDSVQLPEASVIVSPPAESVYVAGRDIGDEHRYVLERKLARKLPGNLLARPSLLLNPWAVRATETAVQEAKAGEAPQAGAAGAFGARSGRGAMGPATDGETTVPERGFSSLEHLPEGAAVLVNLRPALAPDGTGTVSIPRADLRGRAWVHVVAIGPEDVASRHVTLPETLLAPRDLRLTKGLDPTKRFTERKEVSVVLENGSIALEDVTTSELELHDSLARVYRLFATLNPDPKLAEFGFILSWPKLKPEEKRARYSKYASHELNLFLHEKDPEFFAQVVKPFVANKLEKTFLDRWLLEEDLSSYLEPWAFARLNVVERILLARRIAGEPARMGRHVKDLAELSPPDPERLEHLFQTALRGRALETGTALGLEEAAKEVESRRLAQALEAAPAEPAAPAAAAPPRPERERLARKAAPADKADLAAEKALADADADGAKDEALAADYLLRDANRRQAVRQLYRKLDKTQEWAENHYYQLPIGAQDASLITANPFWADFAAHEEPAPFLSRHAAEASRSFPEMMLALAVLDLPFEPAEHKTEIDQARFTVRAASRLIAYSKQIREVEMAADRTPVLVTQNLYRDDDRYVEEGGERRDKLVTGDLLKQVVYGCQVVVTNPTSSRQKLDVLLQIPFGALPVAAARHTHSLRVTLEPYHTWTADYLFYFPRAGTFPHYPVHAARDEKVVAFAETRTLTVLDAPAAVDLTSWEVLSQQGTSAEVLERLRQANLGRLQLDRIAWRMRDRSFFDQAIAVLEERHGYDATLWSYALHHGVATAAREYLKGRDDFVAQCGAALESPLLTIDPVERRSLEHLEYAPLINARAHRLGKSRQILNDRLFEQYVRLLTALCYRPALDADDLLGVSYYLALQDRIDEAAAYCAQVKPEGLAAKLQRDYLEAYVSFSTERLDRARARAAEYASYPVDRWRELFQGVRSQLDEIDGKPAPAGESSERDAAADRLAATEPALELEVEAGEVRLRYQNLAECRVSFYLMDIELLFSRNPFVGEYSGQFSAIQPNAVEVVKLDAAKAVHAFPLPERFRTANVLVEAAGAGAREAKVRFSSAMAVQMIEPRAQLRVTEAASGKALAAAYVKVYARMEDGSVRFYKDGYTDLRGRFDYGSLSTDELDHVARFAILVLAPEHGALVREAAPPKV